MWNTTSTTSKTEINTPATGIIQKSNNKSFFLRMHIDSGAAEKVFTQNPDYHGVKVAVLQVLLMNKDWVLVEIVPEAEL